MRGILGRYLLRETAQTWLVTTTVLLLILVIYQFAEVLSDAASAKMPKDTIFQVLGLASLQLLAILTPISLFLSVLVALGRLYRDSEMSALMACGIGPGGLYRPLLILASLLTIGVGWLALVVGPAANRDIQRIAQEAKERADLSMLQTGRFMSFGNTGMVVYAEAIDDDGSLRNVFVQRRRGDEIELVVADRAWQADNDPAGVRTLRFGDGRRYQGVPGSPRFQIVSFREHGIPFQIPDFTKVDLDPDARPLIALLGSNDPEDMAELQWRFSMPLTVVVLTLLAVPLSRSTPRQGRYSGLIVGVLVFVLYANLLLAAKVWLERDDIPAWLGVWWVHLLFVFIAWYLVYRQQRFRRPKAARVTAETAA